MSLETRHILVTVKAYPNPSRRHIETVCCAGIDLDTGSWIRLYPIPFRYLDSSQQFSKYDIIEVRCEKAPKDNRVESYRIDQDSIRVLRHIDTKHGWRERRQIILPTASKSLCDLQGKVGQSVSLGMFKPCKIGFSWQKAKPENEAKRQACYEQLSFFDKRKNTITRVPFDFYYDFQCAGEDTCLGHRLKIIDWELGQAYRNWRGKSASPEQLMEKIRAKWFAEICSEQNDVWFYVGNMHRFRDQFLILGVFYPRRQAQRPSPTLFDMR